MENQLTPKSKTGERKSWINPEVEVIAIETGLSNVNTEANALPGDTALYVS
ncbi:hypothetical protein [Mucilaginibacter jinjuensis]|uniref:Uncharacterized protein n=1 Tax=Mucilaginibacter jinjuensis TaxID=1176721 RepID=A0ABY7TCH4_9SPHI|nr:hypothetical protein [Mucilaginibacter jinjuensis]WCT14072.1 hypothetical protein PQO05_09005 [Mucilaginibacter jinjuensis]